MKKIIPVGDRILVKKDVISDKSEGGIIINPEISDSTTRTGLVIGIGSEVKGELTSAEGMHVLFNKYAGVACENDLILLKKDEILAIIEQM